MIGAGLGGLLGFVINNLALSLSLLAIILAMIAIIDRRIDSATARIENQLVTRFQGSVYSTMVNVNGQDGLCRMNINAVYVPKINRRYWLTKNPHNGITGLVITTNHSVRLEWENQQFWLEGGEEIEVELKREYETEPSVGRLEVHIKTINRVELYEILTELQEMIALS